MYYHIMLSLCFSQDPCKHQTTQRKCISVPFGTLLYPCSSACGPPPHLMHNIQPQTGKDMDTVSNHCTNKMPPFQNTSVRRHHLILQFLVRHKESYKAALVLSDQPGSSTTSFRLSELCGAPELSENPTEEMGVEEAPGICRLGLEAAASRRGTSRTLKMAKPGFDHLCRLLNMLLDDALS